MLSFIFSNQGRRFSLGSYYFYGVEANILGSLFIFAFVVVLLLGLSLISYYPFCFILKRLGGIRINNQGVSLSTRPSTEQKHKTATHYQLGLVMFCFLLSQLFGLTNAPTPQSLAEHGSSTGSLGWRCDHQSPLAAYHRHTLTVIPPSYAHCR